LRRRAGRPQLKRDPLGGNGQCGVSGMRDFLRFLLIVGFSFVGVALHLRARRHLKDPNVRFVGELMHADLYTDAGQRPRLVALSFILVGTPIIILAFWLLSR